MSRNKGCWSNIGNIKLFAIKNFNLILDKVLKASLPRKQKRPTKIVSGNKNSAYDDVCDVKTFYRRIYFNVINIVVNYKEDQFTQAGYQPSKKI